MEQATLCLLTSMLATGVGARKDRVGLAASGLELGYTTKRRCVSGYCLPKSPEIMLRL
jgi:hypothetical protein